VVGAVEVVVLGSWGLWGLLWVMIMGIGAPRRSAQSMAYGALAFVSVSAVARAVIFHPDCPELFVCPWWLWVGGMLIESLALHLAGRLPPRPHVALGSCVRGSTQAVHRGPLRDGPAPGVPGPVRDVPRHRVRRRPVGGALASGDRGARLRRADPGGGAAVAPGFPGPLPTLLPCGTTGECGRLLWPRLSARGHGLALR
jgi:hypothetical protein